MKRFFSDKQLETFSLPGTGLRWGDRWPPMVSLEELPLTSEHPPCFHVHCLAECPARGRCQGRQQSSFYGGCGDLWPLPNTDTDPEAAALALPRAPGEVGPEEPFQTPHWLVVCRQPILCKPGMWYVCGEPWPLSHSHLYKWLLGRVLVCAQDFDSPSLGALGSSWGLLANLLLTGEPGWTLTSVTTST